MKMKKLLVAMLAVLTVFAFVSCKDEPPVEEPLARDPQKIMESIQELFFGVGDELAYGELGDDCWNAFDDIVYYSYSDEKWLLNDAYQTNSTIVFKDGKYTVTSEDVSFEFKQDPDFPDSPMYIDMTDNKSGARFVWEGSYSETATSHTSTEKYYADFKGYNGLTGTAEYSETSYVDETKAVESHTYNYNNVSYTDEVAGVTYSISCKGNDARTAFEDPDTDPVFETSIEYYTYNGVAYDPDFVEFTLMLFLAI